MKCIKGTCPETSNDPKIAISIIDQEKGTVWGFYCNYECATKDTGAALLHLKDGGDMTNVPEPKVEDESIPVVDTTPELDDTWVATQGYVNELSEALATNLKCERVAQPFVTNSAGKKYQNFTLSFGNIAIRSVNDNVLIDLHNSDHDILLDPSIVKVDDVVKQYLTHIIAAGKQHTIDANTSPF